MKFSLVRWLAPLFLTMTMACGGAIKVAPLPNITVTSDKDSRAMIAKAYMGIGTALNLVDAADRFEATVFSYGVVPAPTHKAVGDIVVDVTKQLQSVNADIKSGALKTWTAIQLRVNPIIDKLNVILSLVRKGGLTFGDFFQAAVNFLVQVYIPGAGGSELDCILSAHAPLAVCQALESK